MIITSTNKPPLNAGTGQTPQKVDVTDSATEIVVANAARVSVYLLNTGEYDVWIAYDVDAQIEKGILLSRLGGSMLVDAISLSIGAISGICRGGRISTIISQEFST